MRELLSVLMAPTRTFQRLREKTDWAWPFLLMSLAMMVAMWMQSSVETSNAGVLEARDWFREYAQTVLGFAVRVVVVGGVLWFLNAMIKGEATYRQLCKVALFSLVPYVLIELLRGVCVQLTGNAFLASSGSVMPEPDHWAYWLNLVFTLAGFLWVFFLTLIGTSVMSERPRATVVLWLVVGWFFIFPMVVAIILMLLF